MTKKLILASMLMGGLCVLSANAGERKVVKVTTPASSADDTEGNDYYIYNAAGQLIWIQSTANSSRSVFEYNDKGQAVKKTTLSWVPADRAYKELNTETYEYSADGNVARMEQYRNVGTAYQSHYVWTYSDYENGVAKSAHMEDIRATVTYQYDYKTMLEYDASNRLLKKTTEEYDYDYPDDGFYAYESYEYTYQDNGDINTETQKTYNYDYEKVRKSVVYSYTYSDLDASFAPSGLKAQINGSSIALSWDAVAGAEQYVVTYDQEHTIVSGTSFTASDIALGEHLFTVQSIMNGEEKNAADPVSATIADPGKLPAENLAASECKKVEETTEEGADVTFFVIPLSWTIPAGHSDIKGIRVYYGNEYVSVESKTATSYDLKLYEWQVRNTDAEGVYTDGKSIDIAVVLVYGSGEAEKSNIVSVNPYNEVNGIENGIAAPVIAAPSSALFNLSGQRIDASAKGIVIQNGKKMLVR